MRRLQLTGPAQRDLRRLLDWSESRFGTAAADRYQRLIGVALRKLAEDPVRSGVKVATSRLNTSTSMYALRHARHFLPPADRVRQPRHVVIFEASEERVLILRVLDERSDIPARLIDR